MTPHPRLGIAATLLTAGVFLPFSSRPAAAQGVASTLTELEARVPAGTEVAVRTVDGRKIHGRLRALSESGLVFDETTVPADTIRTVSRRSGRRPVLTGMVIGLAAGAGLGLAVIVSDQPTQRSAARDGCWGCLDDFGPSAGAFAGAATLLGGAVGAGVGALMRPSMKVVYRAPSPPRVSVAPVITPRRRGIAVTLAF